MTQNKLQLNEGETEALLIDPQNSPNLPLSIKIGQNDICFSRSVLNLGVIFDDKLSMKQQVNKTCQSSQLELRRISPIRHVPTVHYQHHLSLNREDRWGITDDFGLMLPKPLWHLWYGHALITVTLCCQGFLSSWLTNSNRFKNVLLDSFSKPPNLHMFHHFG